MFEVIGVLVVIMIIGAIIMTVGYCLFDGISKFLIGAVAFIILIFALRGCMM